MAGYESKLWQNVMFFNPKWIATFKILPPAIQIIIIRNGAVKQ